MKLGGARQPLKPDPDVIRTLAGLLNETGLSEIEYAVGDYRIRVARDTATNGNGHTHYVAAPAPASPASTAGAGSTAETAPDKDASHPGTVTSPIVGLAYLAPQPGAAPFVRVGDTVSEGQTLLIIEAMKVMNQIRAPRSGRVTRVFAEDAEPVEYGAPLMLIE